MFLSGLRRLKERCWPPRLPLTLDFSCVTFTFICMPLWVLDNLRLFFFNEIVFPVFMIEVVFPEFIDNIVCGESISHTWPHRVVNSNSWWIEYYYFCSYQALRWLWDWLLIAEMAKKAWTSQKVLMWNGLVHRPVYGRMGHVEFTCYVTHPELRPVMRP
jgi:hypothetical protein